MIFTSNFKTAGHLSQAVAISLGVPRGWTGRRYTRLAPNRRLVKIMDPTIFTRLFKAEVLDKLDPMKVIRDLGGDNFILLCWEAPGEFCHRRVVAAWLRKHTGVLIEEFMPSHERHAEWLLGLQEVKPYEPIDETIPDWPGA
ncbi:MAG: hypothetical protein L6277_02590 [Desulfobacterales bacterium]|nr:hypothetical protein [Desulfobacterales bacterium]